MATKQAEKYKNEGNVHFKKGEHALAIEKYTYATELDPNNPVFFTNRSNAYFQMKNYEKSLRDALKSVKADSNWGKGHYRAGMAHFEMKAFPAALAAFKLALDLSPDNASFKLMHTKARAAMMDGMTAAAVLKQEGNEDFKAGRIEQAQKVYGDALAACTDSIDDTKVKLDCLANRAACFRQLYLPELCIEDCTAGLAIDPNHQKILIRRAQAYESMEKYKKALEDFTLVCRLNPQATIAFAGANRLRTAMKKLGMM